MTANPLSIKFRSFLLLFTVCLPFLSFSQNDELVIKKFSPTLLLQHRVGHTQGYASFVIAVSSGDTFKEFIGKTRSIIPLYEYSGANVFVVRCSWKELQEKVLPRTEVQFIDLLRIPKEEVAVSNFDIGTNKINLVHRFFPQYNGNTLGVSVKENRPDTLDIDFKGRYQATPLVSTILSSHATIMSTIIAGAGSTYYEGRGVANGTTISSVNFTSLLPEPDAFYNQFNISVQNHSYGTAIENFYGADARAYDASVITRPSLLHVFSAGNSGTLTSSTGSYTGIPAFANITGSFKMAKNIITVGHTDSFAVVLSPSSKGPAYDGRVKPELIAFGEDGSSGAAAIVSGISLTLQQAYKDLNGSSASSALIKAILLNSADDAGVKGIDYTSGYGAVNAIKAMQAITGTRYFSGGVNTSAVNTHALSIPPNIKQVKITLVWNDPPASANATKTLINDLDLELSLPAMSQSWQPWVLSHFPHIDSLQKLPVRRRDSLNNVEQITIDAPVAGNYFINVRGFNVTVSAPQSSIIPGQFDTLDKFNWQYPTRQDNIFGGTVNTIRWESTYTAPLGQLEYSLNNGSSWQTVSNSVDLSRGYYKWSAPDTFVTGLLRMNLASLTFPSESFTISKRFNIFVGFNCTDSFLFYWNKQRGITNYRVYRLGEKYMEPLITTTDTSVVLGKITNPSLYYSVAPVLGTQTGVRSYGFNYTTQGVECYFSSFFALLNGNTVTLELQLGAVYKVKSIVWEKYLPGGGFRILHTTIPTSALSYSFIDSFLQTGPNTYQLRIELLDGRIIPSQPETIYYFGNSNYIVYPNLAKLPELVKILNKEFQVSRLEIFNTAGAKIYEKKFSDFLSYIPTERLSKGIYFLRLTGEDNKQETFKLVLQ